MVDYFKQCCSWAASGGSPLRSNQGGVTYVLYLAHGRALSASKRPQDTASISFHPTALNRQSIAPSDAFLAWVPSDTPCAADIAMILNGE